MKFHPATWLRLGALTAALTALSTTPLHADEDETTTVRVKFSDPAKPGVFKATLPWSDLRVTGTDGNEIVVTSTLSEKGKGETRPDGLRRLDEEVSFDLTEKNNVAVLQLAGDNPWSTQGSEFTIQLPRHTALVLRTEMGGDVTVENIDGDIDINSMNGEVTLADIGSSAVVNTMNGEIHAAFKTAPAKPVSLSSMNGEINLRLPTDTKANLRLRSHNGAILTDFPEGVLKAKNEARNPRHPTGPISPVAPVAPLPAAAPIAAPAPKPKADLLVTIDDQGRLHLNEDEAIVSPEELKQAAIQLRAKKPKLTAAIRGDEHQQPAKFTQALDLLHEAGIKHIRVTSPTARDSAEEDDRATEAHQLAREAQLAAREAQREAREAQREAMEIQRDALAQASAALKSAGLAGRSNSGLAGKNITGTLNGGGVDIQLSTMNGSITVRQAK